MSLKPVLIAPFSTGLENDLAPWIAPPDSFSTLENAHVRHGRIEKRNGYRFFGALAPNASTFAITAITQASNGIVTAIGCAYATGDIVYIESVGGMTEVNNKTFTITRINDDSFYLNIDTSSFTAYTVGGTVALTNQTTDRVMGIIRYIASDNTKETLVWNQTKTYLFNKVSTSFDELDGGSLLFDGDDYDYFVGVNWQANTLPNRLYFTNGKAYDSLNGKNGIRYFDNAPATVTTLFTPTLSPSGAATTRTLYGGKLLFMLKERLLVLYTYENDTLSTSDNPQRMRWCASQNPSNWDDISAGGGGFDDASTGEQIVSAQLIQDQILVLFTNSVWRIRYIGDPKRPFRWERVNSYRACDGKMASVSYDRYITSLGIRGIVASDTNQTYRIDDKIQDLAYDSINVDEFGKVYCLRDFQNKRWWTLFANLESDENNNALIYDDDSKAFSIYKISMNCLGYGNNNKDYRLSDFTAANNEDTSIVDYSDETLLSFWWQDNQEIFLGGDLNGRIFQLDQDGDDDGVTISSEMRSAAWNPFQQEGSEAQLNYIDFYVDSHQTATATIEFFKNSAVSPYGQQEIDFIPNLGFIATIENISLAIPCNVNAAQHGQSTGNVIYIYGAQGMKEINGGPYTITVVDENNFTLDGIDSTSYSSYTGQGNVYLRRFYRDKIWKRAFAGGMGNEHSIRITSTGIDSPFTFHAFKPYFRKVGRRTIN